MARPFGALHQASALAVGVTLGCIAVALVCPRSALAQAPDGAPPGEASKIEEIRDRALSTLRQHYPETKSVLVKRDAHAKSHGCVKAVVRIASDLPAHLRVGTFAEPGRQTKGWVRFSNGAFVPGADSGYDGRGMALKILSDKPGETTEPAVSHDILMINFPVFFSPDVADYADFAAAGALDGSSEGLRRYFVPGFNVTRWRVRQGLIAYRIASQTIDSPLAIQYHSMVPFAFGTDRAVKYSARPCEGAPRAADANTSRGPDYLREVLWTQLAQGPACFDLQIQEKQKNADIEDATEDWSASPPRSIARVEIPVQRNSDARESMCEGMTFNPGNTPKDQAPLGGINRLRKTVYQSVSAYRTKRNNVPSLDVSRLWDVD